MEPFPRTLVRIVGLAGLGFAAARAEAATPRAYVSVNGSDANTCNVPATPCRTFVGGVSQTTAGGVVIVLDSGTFGGGAISQSVTIDAPAGVVAVAATPLVANPGAGKTIVLRGLTFQAAVPGSGVAISQQSGKLFVENVVIDGWADGLDTLITGEGLFVKNSIFRNMTSDALFVQNGNVAAVEINDSFFERNLVGMYVAGGNGRVSNTVISSNTEGAVLFNNGTDLTFQRCEVSGNAANGLAVDVNASARVSGSTIAKNGTGLNNYGGTLSSFGNNVVKGNATDTNGAITPLLLQ